MGQVVHDCQDTNGQHMGWLVMCPACGNGHLFDSKRWTFNGDYQKPTFSPSMLVRSNHPPSPEDRMGHVCHSFVRDGQIEFLSDCTHAMAGQTVPLEEW